MNFIGEATISAASYYIGFFFVSFLILSLILISGLPAVIRKLAHAARLVRARRKRQVRMLADRRDLDKASDELAGLTLFDEEMSGSQEGDDASTPTSDAA